MRKKSLHLPYFIPTLLVLIWVTTGPFPTPEFSHSQPYRFGRVDYEVYSAKMLTTLAPKRGTGELFAGVGIRQIDPQVGQPLMGFVNSGKSAGVESPCFAKVLSLQSGTTTVSIVTADILMWFPELAAAVAAASDLSPDEIYFTASHTHHSVGGWARGLAEEFFYGKYEARYFDQLVAQFAGAIKDSRKNLVPVKMSYRRATTDNFLQNRLYPNERPAREIAEALLFRRHDNDSPLATLLIFAAHATTVGRDLRQSSADYPGVWCGLWEKQFGGTALFAAGCVGDARMNPQLTTQTLGEKLAATLSEADEIPLPVNDLAMLRASVLPPILRLPLGARWRWLPLVMNYYWQRRSQISVLRLGDLALVGFPADFAGELAADLESFATAHGLRVMITSFNGDWRGYFITPESFYQRNSYERRMALSGAEAGAYFSELAKQAIIHVSGEP